MSESAESVAIYHQTLVVLGFPGPDFPARYETVEFYRYFWTKSFPKESFPESENELVQMCRLDEVPHSDRVQISTVVSREERVIQKQQLRLDDNREFPQSVRYLAS